jgi:hypothetical protein
MVGVWILVEVLEFFCTSEGLEQFWGPPSHLATEGNLLCDGRGCPVWHCGILRRPYTFIFTYFLVCSYIISSVISLYCSCSVFELTVACSERSNAVLKTGWIFVARNIATEGKRNGARRSCRWSTEVSVTDDVSVFVGLSSAYWQQRRRVDRSHNIGNHNCRVLLHFYSLKGFTFHLILVYSRRTSVFEVENKRLSSV